MTRALSRFGRPDIAINNAGTAPPPARSVFLCMKPQLPPMPVAGRGAILDVATADGVADARVMLVDPANSVMTGQAIAIAIDGGLTAI